jgi:hypothetical protein
MRRADTSGIESAPERGVISLPANLEVVLLVGAPRSGTTWLQRLLGSFPQVATAQETDLFDGYILPWIERWKQYLPGDEREWEGLRHKGLGSVLNSAEFAELLSLITTTVYQKVASLKPGANIVLDKNPSYAPHVPELSTLAPAARFINIVRDGRDVVTSLGRAARSWGKGWAPLTVREAAAVWRNHVECVESANLPADRCIQLRYEELLSEPARVVQRCLDFLGLDFEDAFIETVVQSQALRAIAGRRPQEDPILWSGEVLARIGRPPDEPPGFFGDGVGAEWRTVWTPAQRWQFFKEAGELLKRLGYERDDDWVNVRHPHLIDAGRTVVRSGEVGLELWNRWRNRPR